MSNQQPKPIKTPPPTSGIEEMVAAAMNEQGFLFSQAVQATLQFQPSWKISPAEWQYVEREYPVTASDGSQTRIDIVLRNAYQQGAYAAIECKRAHPLYKRWIFFDEHRDCPKAPLHFEVVKVIERRSNPSASLDAPQFLTNANHQIITRPSDVSCLVFNSYLEVAIQRDKRSGYTETVEEAFDQVMKGHTGLLTKVIGFDKEFLMCSVPIVVTTAEVFRADFSINSVPLTVSTGIIVGRD
ncbi:MAG TPA: hypothetical protein VG146_07595 [Verrucomicrobiae bacterium]|nr:hypothetical protein [Verrucomicrobiae bacterium]